MWVLDIVVVGVDDMVERTDAAARHQIHVVPKSCRLSRGGPGRLLVVQHLDDWSYAQTEHFVGDTIRDHITPR